MISLTRLQKKHGIWNKGHFRLNSGLHTDVFVDLEELFKYQDLVRDLQEAAVVAIRDFEFTIIAALGTGGWQFGDALQRAMDHRVSLFWLRQVGGSLNAAHLGRLQGSRVLLVDDVVTTGANLVTASMMLHANGAHVVGALVILDRSLDMMDVGVPVKSLLRKPIEAWKVEQCPMCKKGMAFSVWLR